MTAPWEDFAPAAAPPPQMRGGLGAPSGPVAAAPTQPGGLGFPQPPAPAQGPWSDFAPAAPQDPSIWSAPVGAAELLMTGATALPAKAVAGLGGLGTYGLNLFRDNQTDPADVIRDLEHQLTYQPRSDSAKAGAALMGRGVDWLDRNVAEPVLEQIGNVSPTAENVVRTAVPAVAEAASVALPLARGVAGGAFRINDAVVREAAAQAAARGAPKTAQTAEEVLARTYGDSQQSMGAAAAAPGLTNVSQELRDAITATAQKNGGAINPEVLNRHIEADTLPVRIRLTEGQATQDPFIISQEMNRRGRSEDMVRHYNNQSKELAENVQAMRDEVGPDVFSTNGVEHADTLIASYKGKDADAEKVIKAAYKQLLDANGGNFPIDAGALRDNVSVALHQKLLYDHAPSAVMRTLSRLAESNSMTFENYESMRTNLARIQRSQTADGNEKAAAGVIRSAMETLPLTREAAALKPLADKARSLARAQEQALEADPAYAAAVFDQISPDRFVGKYLINGSRDDVALMRQNLAGDDTALQTMGVAALDYLRSSAKLNPEYQGNFAAAGYNKSLVGLSPKMRSLFSPDQVDQLEKLGRVASYTTFQPRGSYVNNSNSTVAAMAEKAVNAAEKIANRTLPFEAGTLARQGLQNMKDAQNTRRSLAPGAGLGQLREQPPNKK